jgi:hypothetical protein
MVTQAALEARHGSHGKGCGGAPVTIPSFIHSKSKFSREIAAGIHRGSCARALRSINTSYQEMLRLSIISVFTLPRSRNGGQLTCIFVIVHCKLR